MTSPWFLVADIGGTNARLAAYRDDRMVHCATYRTKGEGDLLSLARSFCKEFTAPPEIAVFAAAGPVRNNKVVLTNANQELDAEALRRVTGAGRAHIINDLEAAAWATLAVKPGELKSLVGPPVLAPASRVVIGPGTGLGVAALVRSSGSFHCQPGEGGHIGIGPRDTFEVEVFKALRTRWPEVFFGEALIMEAEGLLSGTGLPQVYQAVQLVLGEATEVTEPEAIFAGARFGTDPAARKTVSMFKAHLAQVAGDLGLLFGADGGVVLCGGIATGNPWLFDQEFVEQFQIGGRFTKVRKKLGIYLVQEEHFCLNGANHFAMRVC